jgi:heterodisulfide reductase subunit B
MYERSLRAVFRMLGITLEEIPDWNCCGAASAHILPATREVALSVRNLLAPEQMGLHVVTGCAACFFRLRSALEEMRTNQALAAEVNAVMPTPFRAEIEVHSVLDVLLDALEACDPPPAVTRTLDRLRPVCYYGCLFMRAPGGSKHDAPEHPQSMETLLRAAGIEPLDWCYQTDCCGASAILTQPDLAHELMNRILREAQDRGANAIVTACPMCQLNLELAQQEPAAMIGIQRQLPVFFVTQLLGLAWGLSNADVEVDRLITGVEALPGVLA